MSRWIFLPFRWLWDLLNIANGAIWTLLGFLVATFGFMVCAASLYWFGLPLVLLGAVWLALGVRRFGGTDESPPKKQRTNERKP